MQYAQATPNREGDDSPDLILSTYPTTYDRTRRAAYGEAPHRQTSPLVTLERWGTPEQAARVRPEDSGAWNTEYTYDFTSTIYQLDEFLLQLVPKYRDHVTEKLGWKP